MIERGDLITVQEAAMRIARQKKTLHNWISEGKLRGDQGLCYVMGRPMIDWPRFQAAFVKRAA